LLKVEEEKGEKEMMPEHEVKHKEEKKPKPPEETPIEAWSAMIQQIRSAAAQPNAPVNSVGNLLDTIANFVMQHRNESEVLKVFADEMLRHSSMLASTTQLQGLVNQSEKSVEPGIEAKDQANQQARNYSG
jgi:hypothetical protein